MSVSFGFKALLFVVYLSGLGANGAFASPAAAQSAAEAPPGEISTAAFASRSPFTDVKLSPDGTMIVTKAVADGKQYIALIRAEGHELFSKYAIPDKNDIESVRWAGPDKLLVTLSALGDFLGEEALYTRLALIEIKTGEIDILGKRYASVQGDNIVFVSEDGAYALVSMQRSIYDYPAVVRFELVKGGSAKVVQDPKDHVWDWIADETGVVRMGIGYQNRDTKIWYRSGPDDKYALVQTIKEEEQEEKDWSVVQILSGTDNAYVFHDAANGRRGLYRMNLTTQQIVDTVLELPDNDIGSVWMDDNKPYAAIYTGDHAQAYWFDKKQADLYAALGKALSEPDHWIFSRAKDDSRMLVWAGSESDPGAYYTFTPGKGTLDVLLEVRPKVPVRDLATPKAFTYTARDGIKINAYLTLPRGREAKNLPLIILPHGGPYWVRDELEYNDEVQLLANRGYAVIQPNFRGSGGYGDAFLELGRGQIGRGMQDDIDDAMDWAVKEGIAARDRVCVVGSSYGGYAALWAVIRNPERYRCAASFAGVTDWDLILKYDKRFFSRYKSNNFRARVEGEGEFDLDAVSPYRLAHTLTRPVLIAQGKEDTRVPYSQYRKFLSAVGKASVQPVELVFEDEGHGFDKPENEQKWYDELTAFLAQHNPAD